MTTLQDWGTYRAGDKSNVTYLILSVLISLSFFISAQAQENAYQPDIRVDGKDVGRQFDGVGAISAGANARHLIDYPEPQRSQVLDFLYKPGYGASLQILKVEMGGGSNTTAGSDPSHMRSSDEVNCDRGYQWWLMKEARKRNPDILLYAQQWTAPKWLGGVWTENNIDYHLSWLKCAEEHGLQIDFIGGWNEQGFDADWFVDLDSALEKHYPEVRIPAADEIYQDSTEWTVVDSMIANPEFKNAVDQVAMHWPCQWRTKYRDCPSPQAARDLGTPLQMTNAGMAHDVGGPPNVRGLNRMYIDGKFTSYLIWNTAETYYANLPIANSGIMQARWPWSGFYDVGKNIWAFAHTTQFTEPGWHYLDSGSGRLDNKASYVTLQSPDGSDYSMIIETMDVSGKDTLHIKLDNLPHRMLRMWQSDFASNDTSDHFQYAGKIIPHEGHFRLVVRPNHAYSITSVEGPGKGGAKPNATVHEEFPLPFNEDFEEVEHGRMARYFANMNGAFEAQPCQSGRSGTCYQQMVTEHPITWVQSGEMPPTIMVGDPRWKGDYTVSSQVMIPEEGYVEVIGRVAGHHEWTDIYGGYHAQIGTEGWKLFSVDAATGDTTVLESGDRSIEPKNWYELSLKMHGKEIEMLLDGERLTQLEDNRQLGGNVSLRSGPWIQAQFDDVSVTPTGPSPEFVPANKMSVVYASSGQDFWKGWTFEPEYVIDDRPETRWQTEDDPTPHSITLDLGKTRNIEGLQVRPRFNSTNAMITGYRIETGVNGEDFKTIQEGTWPAIAGNKIAHWPKPVEARYVRLVATNYVNRQASAAEINVITNLPDPWRMSY